MSIPIYPETKVGALREEERVRFRIDAGAILKTGEHPMGKVRARVAELEAGERVCLASSFPPQPLIDVMRRGGWAVYSAEPSPGRHVTYIPGRPVEPARPPQPEPRGR